MRRYLLILFFCITNLTTLCYAQKIDVYSRPLQSERSRDYDVIHYKVKLRFDEDRKVFWGENTITLSPFKDDFTRCVLDAETFTVTSVLDENSQSLEFEQPPHQLIVHLARSYQYEDSLSFTVFYSTEKRISDSDKSRRSGLSPGISFADESPRHPRIIEAISWPIGARHWYPCYDHPNDKTTQEMILTVRSEYKALSNGRLLSVTEDKKNETKTYHWFLDRPHSTYLSMFAAGPYEVIEDSLNSLPINYWVYEKDVKDALRSFHKTPEIIAFFNKEFGYQYPWTKYDQVIQPGLRSGMECTSATLIGESYIHDARAEQDFPSHWLVAHEAAHQWWGDLITLRDWGHTWINESFATYSEYLYAKHDLGGDEGAVNLLNKKNSYLSEAHNRYIRPIVFHRWDLPGNNFDRHTYPKGAVVIQMMRWILGEIPFLKTMSHFLHKHEFQPVDTDDFLTAVKETTGQNLDWFFEQWLLKPGHPIFDVKYSWNPGTKHVNMRIAQVQDTSKRIPVFKTPVVIGIVTPDGKTSRKVWLREPVEEFHFKCDQRPLLVRFDEGNYLLKEWTFEKSVDELLYQLKNDDVIGRMWAASELGKFPHDSRVTEGLQQSAKDDPFWAVRRDAVSALSGFQEKEFIGFLRQRAEDRHSKVRTAALSVLGDLKRADLIPFYKERFNKDDSYVAQAEALRAIGKAGEKSSERFLKKASEMESPRNIVKRAADWALKQLDK